MDSRDVGGMASVALALLILLPELLVKRLRYRRRRR